MSNLGVYEYVTDDIGANGNNIIVSSYAVSPGARWWRRLF